MSNATFAHLSGEELRLLQRCEGIGRDRLASIAATGQPGRVNRPLVAALGQEGLLNPVLLEGPEVSAVYLCLVREGLGRYCTDAETAFALQGLAAHPLLVAGHETMKSEWLPRIAGGAAVAGFALTEPEAGSDAAALALCAKPDGDGFRLTGDKIFISNAPDADFYTVFARTTPGSGSRGITAFAIPAGSDGLTGEVTPMLSSHPIGALHLDGVKAERHQVIGEIDAGFALAMQTLDLFRPSVGAFAVGAAQAALDHAVAHALERRAFGRPLAQLQALSHRLADIAVRIQAARLLVHAAAAAYDSGVRPVTQAAAMAKLFATETAFDAVDAAIQVHGARGLVRGHPLEHLYREVRGIRIYEGASEVQREIIARGLFRTATPASVSEQ